MAGSICIDGRRGGHDRPGARLRASPGTDGGRLKADPSDGGFAAGASTRENPPPEGEGDREAVEGD